MDTSMAGQWVGRYIDAGARGARIGNGRAVSIADYGGVREHVDNTLCISEGGSRLGCASTIGTTEGSVFGSSGRAEKTGSVAGKEVQEVNRDTIGASTHG